MQSFLKFKNKISDILIIEYVYFLQCILSIYLVLGVSENYNIIGIINITVFAIMVICILEAFVYWNNNQHEINKIVLFSKVILSSMIIWVYLINIGIIKIYQRFKAISNMEQLKPIEIITIMSCFLLIIILILFHAKYSGFIEKQWISLIFCLFLLVWIVFGFFYYVIEYYGVSESFSYSDGFVGENNVDSMNILKINEISKKELIELIVRKKDYINEKLKLEVNGQILFFTEEKIGENWGDYYYENYIDKYNAFDIINIEPITINQGYLTEDSGFYNSDDYLNFFKKDCLCVTVRLFNSNVNQLEGAISKEKYDSNVEYSNKDFEDIVLLFESDNYYNYCIMSSVSKNLFLDCLSESNTLLDNMISDIRMGIKDYPTSIIDYLYYSGIIITTVGFGDMTPISKEAKILSNIEALLGLVIMGIFIAKAFDNVGEKKKR
ncbi:MAG: two pore domain potassium channel family protein [Acetobacterium woodii]|nr:two pore domain potassium channel family protein [Acetobacterium woodii]